MAVVNLSITTIATQQFNGQTPIDIYGDGPWTITGQAIPADGNSVTRLTWNYNLMQSSQEISRASLPTWTFQLDKSDIATFGDGSQSSFWVDAYDDDDDPTAASPARVFGYVTWHPTQRTSRSTQRGSR
jgi:hypothetical protein